VRPGRAVNHSPPSSAAVMEEQSYTSTHPLGHTGPVTGSLYPFFFTLRRYSLFLSKFKRIIHKTEDEMCTPVRTGLPLFPICILYGLAYCTADRCPFTAYTNESFPKPTRLQISQSYPLLLPSEIHIISKKFRKCKHMLAP